MDIAPPEKHGTLDPLKAIEEFSHHVDRLSQIGHCRPRAQAAKVSRCKRNIDVTKALEAQEYGRQEHEPTGHFSSRLRVGDGRNALQAVK
jgi:hypothetical protein